MNLTKSTCALFVAIASVCSNIQAASINTSNETANISIKQIVMPGSADSGLVSCHNTLANCLVSLKFGNPNEGWIILLNNSRVNALNVKATLPAVWEGSVIPTTTCGVIRAGESCTLKFKAVVPAPLSRQTIPVKGDNTTAVFFDMEVIPSGIAAALSVSIIDLALSITGLTLNGQPSGLPRIITIGNTGGTTATGLAINYPIWPLGTTASSNCGATLAAGSQCIITVTPNTTPTSSCSNTGIAPTPGVITISADGVTPVASNVVVLNYGCIYQGGYLFAMSETADSAESIGGTVVTQVDQAPRGPGGIVWSSNGAGSAQANASFDSIPGIAETSTTGSSVPTYANAQTTFNNTYSNTGPPLVT